MMRRMTGVAAGLLVLLACSAPAAAAPLIPSYTVVSSSLNPSLEGNPVTFTSTTTANGAPITTGTIDWSYQPLPGSTITPAGSSPLNGNGQTTFTTSAFTLGSTVVKASFNGGAEYTPSSGDITQRVNAPPPPSKVTLTLLMSSLMPATFGDLVTFTSQTFFEGLAPTGEVTFTARLNNAVVETFATAIGADGFAYFSTSTLPVGDLFVIAAYEGDDLHFASDGSLRQQVLEPVPEPATWALMLAGLALLAGVRRRA